MTVETLEALQNEESFNLFWEKVELHIAAFEIDEPILPRKRKCPQKKLKAHKCSSGGGGGGYFFKFVFFFV